MAAAAPPTSPFTPSPSLFNRPSFSRIHFSNLFLKNPNPNPTSSSNPKISSGPRNNRQPIRRGRTLSTEAILTIQSLKRARNSAAATSHIISTSVARLIKSDLLAALAELQRQDQWNLSLQLFQFARRENWYRTDCALYADVVATLARSKRDSEIDVLVVELMEELEAGGGVPGGDLRGPARLVKALVAAGNGKAVKDVYGMMRRGGCELNEYLFKFMMRGLRGLGEDDAARRVEKDYDEVWGVGGDVGEPVNVNVAVGAVDFM